MAIREIIILPDKQLRLVSKPIEKVTPEVRKLADDMFETMYAAPGIGLAAIQVAQPIRLITMDPPRRKTTARASRPRVFINPRFCRHRRNCRPTRKRPVDPGILRGSGAAGAGAGALH